MESLINGQYDIKNVYNIMTIKMVIYLFLDNNKI